MGELCTLRSGQFIHPAEDCSFMFLYIQSHRLFLIQARGDSLQSLTNSGHSRLATSKGQRYSLVPGDSLKGLFGKNGGYLVW